MKGTARLPELPSALTQTSLRKDENCHPFNGPPPLLQSAAQGAAHSVFCECTLISSRHSQPQSVNLTLHLTCLHRACAFPLSTEYGYVVLLRRLREETMTGNNVEIDVTTRPSPKKGCLRFSSPFRPVLALRQTLPHMRFQPSNAATGSAFPMPWVRRHPSYLLPSITHIFCQSACLSSLS